MLLMHASHAMQKLAVMTDSAKGLRTACQLFLQQAARQTNAPELIPRHLKRQQPQQMA